LGTFPGVDLMRSTTFLAVGFWLAALGAAQAQMDSGLEVRVNPSAARAGSGTLLYPGGEYGRYVPELLTPGEKGGPIRLHMPSRHRVTTGDAAAPRPKRVAAAPPPEPKPQPAPKPAPKPAVQPQQQAPANGTNTFGMPDYSNVFGNQQASAPKPAPAAKPPVKTASAAPPPSNNDAGLTKRSVILFAKDAADPAEGALGAIKFLASDLNSAMTRSASRVELQAYAGAKGDKGSDARRLSLKRALAIRQVLIEDGVSADRIDVRAMGGVEDSGPADRVDVFVRA